MRFSPSDLAALAQMKAKGNQQPEPTGFTYQPEPPPMPVERNGADPGNVGQTLHMPTGLTGGTSPVMGGDLLNYTPVEEPGRASVPGVSDYIMERVNNGAYNLNLASITRGDGATRDALVNAGYGDWVKGAYERAMDQRAAHYGGNGADDAMGNAQLGWYNDRYGTYGGQQAQTQPVGQPMPIAPQQGNPSGMFNGLAGVTNIVRSINGQQPPPPPQQNQQQPYKQQQTQPQQESPSWGQNTNTIMKAGSPPSHGGGNPGYSGMMNNTADTMAALKALIANLSRR